MVSAFLIVSIIIIAPLVLFCCLLLLAYFGHPDDHNQAWIPKIITVIGLWLAFSSVLALPYDVSNSRGAGGGLRVDILWQILYIAMACFIALIVPFAFFYYESDSDPNEDKGFFGSQFCSAFMQTLAFFAAFVILLVVLYSFLNKAEIPVRRVTHNSSLLGPVSNTTFRAIGCQQPFCVKDRYIWSIPVTFPTYITAFISFIGWFFFTLFAGIGLVALPLDLINEWRTRPAPLKYQDYYDQKQALGQRAKKLIEVGDKLMKDLDEPKPNRKQRNDAKNTLKKFETAYYFLKQDYEVLRISKEEKGGNPIWYFFKFILGICGGIISITWIIHIAIFVLPITPIHPFLNNFFIELEEVGGGGFPLFGIIAFTLYAYWLIWCVVKGNFRFGARFLFIRLYPMEIGNTLMNAFLFNTWLIMICSVSVVMFCVRAFPVYTRLTQIDLLFGSQIQHLQFFRYFWTNNVFIWALIAIAFITLVYLIIRPRNRAKEIEARLDAVQKGSDD